MQNLSLSPLKGIFFFPSLLQDKLNSSCSRAYAKAVKRKPKHGMKLRASDKNIGKEPSLGMTNIVSSISSNQKSESCGTSTTSPTQSQTQEGLPLLLLCLIVFCL